MNSYTIKVNGCPVSGIDGNFGRTYGNSDAETGIKLGEYYCESVIIQGKRNLKSYVDKILTLEDAEVNTIEISNFTKEIVELNRKNEMEESGLGEFA